MSATPWVLLILATVAAVVAIWQAVALADQVAALTKERDDALAAARDAWDDADGARSLLTSYRRINQTLVTGLRRMQGDDGEATPLLTEVAVQSFADGLDDTLMEILLRGESS